MSNDKYLKILDAFKNLVTEISAQERERQTPVVAQEEVAPITQVIAEDLPPDMAVGDARRFKVYKLSSNYLPEDDTEIGEAWQDEDGKLYGTGICAVMLFEPLSQGLYYSCSIGLDESPLSVLAMRISMSNFAKIEWEVGVD